MLTSWFGNNLENFYFRQPWPLSALYLSIAGALVVSFLFYRKERSLAVWKRILLVGVRAAIFILLILLLFEPVSAQIQKVTLPGNILVLLDVSESMGFADVRKRDEELADAAISLGKMGFNEAVPSEEVKPQMARVDRLALAKGILQNPQLKLFHEPDGKYRLHYFSFGDRLEAAPDEPERLRNWLDGVQANSSATQLGEALRGAVDRFSGQPIAGVIVLTDGGSNAGVDPLEAAHSLHTPVFPIPLGLRLPDDVRLASVTPPDAVFPRDKVPVRVQIQSTPGYAGREVDLIVRSEGRQLERKRIVLKGVQWEELAVVPEQTSGLVKLEIAITPLAGEATEQNNYATRTIKIIDEKIKVLYVEGRPRWEYRYLRGVLTRDPRMSVKFLLTEGDEDLPKASDQYISSLPEDEAATFKYDLIILGDVRADYFSAAQQAWVEKLVRDKGGSFLLLAGHQHAPMTYGGTPFANLLPVKPGLGCQRVDVGVHPVMTEVGAQSKIMNFEPLEEGEAPPWSLVRPLIDLPRLGGAKPGATVLATISNQDPQREPYPLVAWQRYGNGKSMFVASDQLWRLRFKRGDACHAHFWSQTIQFLTLSRLLGENKRIRLETDRKNYQTGERILVQAAVLDEEFHPLRAPTYTVLVEQIPPKGEPRTMSLKPVPGMEGTYQGYLKMEQGGDYRVRTAQPADKDANSPNFRVETVSREKQELDARRDQLAKLAELTGGQMMSVRDLPTLAEKIPDVSRVNVLPPRETELWNNWWIFSAVLGLAATEWFIRRRSDVA